MEINDFVKFFASQFDETDASEFSPETKFRELDEWSSLIGLAILNAIGQKYSLKLTASELKGTETVLDVYNLVNSRL